MSSPSSPSSPPTRPVPVPPATQVDPAPAPEHSVDDEIDASTLRFLSASLRDPYLPWLLRLFLFTLAAKLVRVLSPALLRFIARLTSYLWTALAALVRFTAWSATWLGLVALCAWLLLGAGGALVYTALSARPRYRAWARAQPFQARLARKAATYGTAWVAARRVLGAWAAKLVVVVYAAREAWAFFHRRAPAPGPVAMPVAAAPASPSRPAAGWPGEDAPRTAEEDAADAVDDEELERWARQAKEELLRDSLLRQGRKAGSGARGAAAGEGPGGEGDDGGALVEDAGARAVHEVEVERQEGGVSPSL